MRDPSALRPAPAPAEIPVELKRAEHPCPELGRFLYTAVGGDWYWTDRLSWTYDRWHSRMSTPGVETWVAYVQGTPAGYFELEAQLEGQVEIASFGVLPQFTGKGLGGYVLTAAIQRAWKLGTRRVWVHTCTLDGPHALANYQARGMTVFREETTTREIEDRPPGPWPGAHPAAG